MSLIQPRRFYHTFLGLSIRVIHDTLRIGLSAQYDHEDENFQRVQEQSARDDSRGPFGRRLQFPDAANCHSREDSARIRGRS